MELEAAVLAKDALVALGRKVVGALNLTFLVVAVLNLLMLFSLGLNKDLERFRSFELNLPFMGASEFCGGLLIVPVGPPPPSF